MAAAQETGLIEALEEALPLASSTCPPRLAHSTRASRERVLLTLLFLNAVGLRRTYELRSYTGTGLALLSKRQRAYSYRHTERFLAQVARAGGDETLTDALATWTAKLWLPHQPEPGQPPPAFGLRVLSVRKTTLSAMSQETEMEMKIGGRIEEANLPRSEFLGARSPHAKLIRARSRRR